jgi:2-succinyl-6-hydroxy-2,4-cyclohexadiene-1-carboxylate synthase
VTLHVELTGRADGVPLVMAHGFTQTGRLWGQFGALLAGRRRLVQVDLPGHADSGAARADLPEGGDLLIDSALAALAALDEPGADTRVDLLGYSLGARMALHAALARPERLRSLVLIGATGGIDDPGSRDARRTRDEQMADELESSGDVAAFLRRWTGAPMFAGLRPDAADLGERARNTPAGLASSLRLAGTGTQQPLWDRLGGLSVPTLVLAGADDPRFVEHGRRLARTLPSAVLTLVAGAGHAAHLHRPGPAARIVTGWLESTPGD